MKGCAVDGCTYRHDSHGFCSTHVRRAKRGMPLTGGLYWWRFDQNIAPPDAGGCHLWTGSVNSSGYGVFGRPRKYAHRLAYERANGAIPDGLHLDHLCRVPTCVNPAHLEPVTPRTNMLRGNAPNAILWRSNRCGRGHEFTPENTYYRPDGAGRQCRACIRLRGQKTGSLA